MSESKNCKKFNLIQEAENPFALHNNKQFGSFYKECYNFPFLPGIRFFKMFAMRNKNKNLKDFHKLKINIVDTLVFNEKEMPLFLLRTNEKGFLDRIDLNRNTDVIKIFKENNNFKTEFEQKLNTDDLVKENEEKKKKKGILSKSLKKERVNKIQIKTKILGKIINWSKIGTKSAPKFQKFYDVIKTEKSRRNIFEKYPFVILKRSSSGNGRICNSSTLITEKDFFDQCFRLMNSRDDLFVIQKYVKGLHNNHSILRTCYSQTTNETKCFLISNNDPINFINKHTNSLFHHNKSKKPKKNMNSNSSSSFIINKKNCSVKKFKFGKHYDEAMIQLNNIKIFLERTFKTYFTELICEFIRAGNGKLYLFNVRTFKVESPFCENLLKLKITHRGKY